MNWNDAAYIVDLSFWAHRAYHAVKPVTDAKGEPVNMVHGFVQMLRKLLVARRPRWLVFVAEAGGRTWRHDLYPEYKAKRPPHPEGFDQQLVRVARLLELYRIPVVVWPGFEADDGMCTLTKKFRKVGYRVILVTADKDLCQLVTAEDPYVVVWDGKVKEDRGENNRVLNRRNVKEHLGVYPERVGDLLALAGDSTDGIPGLPGIGFKTAADLLEGTTDLDHMMQLKQWSQNAVGKTLRTNGEQLKLYRQLVSLRDDVPISIGLQDCAVGDLDVPGLVEFYREVGIDRNVVGIGPKRVVDEREARDW